MAKAADHQLTNSNFLSAKISNETNDCAAVESSEILEMVYGEQTKVTDGRRDRITRDVKDNQT